MNIIIVDDNAQFSKSLKFFLEQQYGHIVLESVSSGEAFLNLDYSIVFKADIVLMDIFMGGIDGFETAKRANWEFKDLNMIAITMDIDKMFLDKILESGFRGCVFKGDISENIEKAIQTVHNGQIFVLNGIPVTKE